MCSRQYSVGQHFDSIFEEEVAGAIEKRGYRVDTQVGTSGYRIDIGVIDPRAPGRYLVGVECDGRMYHSAKSARERDRLRQEILEGHGWKILRVWSTDWFRNPSLVMDRLIAQIEQLAAEPLAEGTPAPASRPTSEALHSSLPEESLTLNSPGIKRNALSVKVSNVTARQYCRVEFDGFFGGDIVEAPRSNLVSAILQCVRTEAPIHTILLMQRVSFAWGNKRTGPRIATRIRQELRYLEDKGEVRTVGDFVWLSGSTGS